MKGKFPLLHFTPPTYNTSITPAQAEQALATLLNQLELQKTPPARKPLNLNQATASDLHALLTSVRGIGAITVNKIVKARDQRGDFVSDRDFDRRVRGLTFARLQKLCRVHGFLLSLSPSLSPTSRVVWKGGCGRSEGGRKRGDSEEKGYCLVMATWNTGRMSRNGRFYESKMRHLERFVREGAPDLLILQELCRGVARDIGERLGKVEGDWGVFDSGGADASLAVLYRMDKVRVAHLQEDVLRGILDGFLRVPLVGKVGLVSDGGKGLVLVNVHLEQRDPREEIERLGDVALVLKDMGNVLFAGDFNMSAETSAFEKMRGAGMVEIVRPEGARRVHPYLVLSCATTVGGEWLDNFWVKEERRKDVRDAWCFDFGGIGRRLGTSGYEFAAERRSCSSDHLPLVMRMRVV